MISILFILCWTTTLAAGQNSWTQQAKLLPTPLNPSGGPRAGRAVDLSSTGSIAAVGAFNENNASGSVTIFVNNGTDWVQEAKLSIPKGNTYDKNFGQSVKFGQGGNIIVIGVSTVYYRYPAYYNSGAAYIFTRSEEGEWNFEARLPREPTVDTEVQGWSVAISEDGEWVASGGTAANNGTGGVWMYSKAMNQMWSHNSKLVGTDCIGNCNQGWEVSMNVNGDVLASAGIGDTNSTGAVWIFIRTGDKWTQQGPKLVGTGSVAGTFQGWGISLSGLGDTLASGGTWDDEGIGATWIFVRDAETQRWNQQGEKLVGSGYVGRCEQGWDVRLSYDGNLLLSSGPNDGYIIGSNDFWVPGAIWVFTRDVDTYLWTQQGEKIIVSNNLWNASQGWSLGLDKSGTVLLSGGPGDDDNIGAAWIFTSSEEDRKEMKETA